MIQMLNLVSETYFDGPTNTLPLIFVLATVKRIFIGMCACILSCYFTVLCCYLVSRR